MASIELELSFLKIIPVGGTDPVAPEIRQECDGPELQTLVHFLSSLFSLLAGGCSFEEIHAESDAMGGIDIRLGLSWDTSCLKMTYSQSITQTWHHPEIDEFILRSNFPGEIMLSCRLDLTGPGNMRLYLYRIGEATADRIRELAGICFEKTGPPGSIFSGKEGFREPVSPPSPPEAQDPARGSPLPSEKKPERERSPSPLDLLLEVFARERDKYMEWHDGPSLHEVDEAMHDLTREDREKAAEITAERLRHGYDPYLGRAAELLGTEGCVSSLLHVLESEPDNRSASDAAGNLLVLGPSAAAIETLKKIIGDRSLFWGDRISALVDLKIAMQAGGKGRPVSDFIPSDMKTVLLEAVIDDEYLVRYHAADALLRGSGYRGDISGHKEIFPLVCGKSGTDKKPSSTDKSGFRKAAEMLRLMLYP